MSFAANMKTIVVATDLEGQAEAALELVPVRERRRPGRKRTGWRRGVRSQAEQSIA